jgi:glycosyltransferase involved in cell wall biosynthesis
VSRFSVVVPAYNAAADLDECLKAIFDALPSGGEVVVVDDGSSDGTLEIARRYPARVLTGPNRGPASARNSGAGCAQGDILVFLDADVVPHLNTVRSLVDCLEGNTELAAVFGSYDDQPHHPQLVSQFRNLLHHYTHQRGREEASTFWTGCGAIRREWFERVGGFRPTVIGIEDVDLGLRVKAAGGRIRLAPSIQAQHRKRWTLFSMIRTDVWMRAVPWMKLAKENHGLSNDLNTRHADRLSAALVLLAILFSWCWEALLLLLAATGVKADWHLFLIRKRGFGFALRAAPLHWLYLAYSAATFGVMKIRGY